MRDWQHRQGFTQFEFLVAVAITLVVVIIFAVNSRTVLRYVKVLKVREEHAMLQRALENYRLDYADFPGNDRRLAALDSPTAYVASLPPDPFQQGARSYYYIHRPGGGYDSALISPGPDSRLDFRFVLAAVDEPPRAQELREEQMRRQIAFARSVIASTADRQVVAGVAATPPPSRAALAPPAPEAPALAVTPWGPDREDPERFQQYVVHLQYDPTNGTNSAGDIITLSIR